MLLALSFFGMSFPAVRTRIARLACALASRLGDTLMWHRALDGCAHCGARPRGHGRWRVSALS